MGRVDGTSRDNSRPAGVAFSLQVNKHSVEPIFSNRCRNLFSHKDRGPTGFDKVEERGPEVALVILRFLFSSGAEWLAWRASGPSGSIISPAGKP
jgi:hypothetical protein